MTEQNITVRAEVTMDFLVEELADWPSEKLAELFERVSAIKVSQADILH